MVQRCLRTRVAPRAGRLGDGPSVWNKALRVVRLVHVRDAVHWARDSLRCTDSDTPIVRPADAAAAMRRSAT